MDVDSENVRWSRDGVDVTWCDSAEGMLAALAAGSQHLEVGAVHDSRAVLEVLARASGQLLSLSLVGCGFDAAALASLGQIMAPTQLQGIGVSNNPDIGSSAWVAFWNQLPRTVVKWDFGDDELSDEVLPALAHRLAAGQGNLQELFLDGNDISDLSALLPVIASSPQLTELDVGDNNILDASVGALAAVLPGAPLTTLVLGRNSISDLGALALVSVLPQTKIRALHLDSTQLGDATADALIRVLHGTQLEELDVEETRITDAGVQRLCVAMQGSRLTHLEAYNSSLSEQTKAALEAILDGGASVH